MAFESNKACTLTPQLCGIKSMSDLYTYFLGGGTFDTSGIINFYCNDNVYVSNKARIYGNYYSYLEGGFRFCGMFTAYKESEQTYVYKLAGSGLGAICYYASESSSTSNTYNVSGLTQINIKSYTLLIERRFEISSIDYLDSNGDFQHVTF